jgi:hypothetical protein
MRYCSKAIDAAAFPSHTDETKVPHAVFPPSAEATREVNELRVCPWHVVVIAQGAAPALRSYLPSRFQVRGEGGERH